jgi:coenzyme F420-0:L-glutamate ligase/coenzyme F420-1:gamma-L-glutamate ligase
VIRDWSFGPHDGSENLFRSEEDDIVREALREWSFEE